MSGGKRKVGDGGGLEKKLANNGVQEELQSGLVAAGCWTGEELAWGSRQNFKINHANCTTK